MQFNTILRPINYRDLIPKYSWMINNEEDSYHENYIKHLLKKYLKRILKYLVFLIMTKHI